MRFSEWKEVAEQPDGWRLLGEPVSYTHLTLPTS